MKPKNIYRQSLTRLFILYIVLVTLISAVFPALYILVFPESSAELLASIKEAFSVGFSMNSFREILPDEPGQRMGVFAFLLLFFHAISLLVLNMIFKAVVVAKLIRPTVDLRTSEGAVFAPHYGTTKTPHILFRLINASHFDLYNISLKAFLTIHYRDEKDSSSDMIYYFPVPYLDPMEVPVLKALVPWIVAVPAETVFSNSIIEDYQLDLSLEQGNHPGHRQLEVLISGTENEASSSFLEAVVVELESDEKAGLRCGHFRSLPSTVTHKQLRLIHERFPTKPGQADSLCGECRFSDQCRFQTLQSAD